MARRKIGFVLSFAMLGLGGCASHPSPTSELGAITTNDEIERLAADFASARQTHVDVLAPDSFDKAEESYTRAQLAPDAARIATVRNLLRTAVEEAAPARARFATVLAARQAASQANAPDLASSEFRTADSDLKDLVKLNRRAPSTSIDSKVAAVIAAYQRSQAQAHVADLLRKARETQGAAKHEGAEVWAPKTWRETEAQLDSSATIIGREPDLTPEASISALKAEQSAEHLLSITRLSKELKGRSWEDIAVKLEDQDLRIQDFAMKANLREPAAAPAGTLQPTKAEACAPGRVPAPVRR